MSSSVRQQFAAQLEADWANIPALDSVRIIASERNVDITGPTAVIRQKTVARLDAAPQSHRAVGLVVALVSAHEDFDRAGDELETLVFAALDYFDTRVFQPEERATASQWDDTHLSFDIPLTIIATKE